ncbi:MAG: CocE/NonD family hydrolase [Deltaproteobacteria bacterium]|nr:CocE/NonD family hydrolase [Deltaproteobacteria bacterium]
MNTLINMKFATACILPAFVIGICMLYKGSVAQEKVSAFGKYEGYSEAIYDGGRRTSDYLPLSNGTRLAYDLILPTRKGVPAGGPLPVLFKYTPYLRTFTIFDKEGKNIIADLYDLGWKERAMLRIRYWLSDQGRFMDPLFRTGWLKNMVKHGYAVIVVERPGTGASFGRLNPSFEAGAREVDEILSWIAAQKWCNGNIGMYGDSWQGQIQFSAASTGNPHLKAIFPASTWLDNYTGSLYPGGVYNKGFGSFFEWSQKFLNSNVITPVDRDSDGKLLAQAGAERGSATLGEKFTEVFKQCRYRDSTTKEGYKIWLDSMAHPPFMNRVNQARVPTYMVAGWYDLYVRDMFQLYANLSVPKRLLVRPLDHSGIEKKNFDLDFGVEAHRWFDYWLKGISNGIMDEPPIHYYLLGTASKEAWQTADSWPVKNAARKNFYFGPRLQTEHPSASESFDTYRVDYSTTTGKLSRWAAVNWGHKYPNMRSNDAKALTYTTAPLTSPVQVIGHPVVHIWLQTDVPDLDWFVYLEEVDEDGSSIYVTEGILRASHRAIGKASFENLGLPWHNHFQSELQTVPAGEPIELVFDILPTAFEFSKGRRIRVSIAFADADNFDTPVIAPAPVLHLLRDKDHPSFIELPLLGLK